MACLALLPLVCLFAFTRPFALDADIWEYAATVRELSARLLHPQNPLLALPGNTSPRFTPYTIVWGLFMRATGLAVFPVMGIAALANFLLLVTGIRRFASRRFGSPALPLTLLATMLLVWGQGYAQATAYHLEFLLVSLSYMGIFAFAICLHALAGLAAWLDGEGPGALARYGAVMVIAFICHPITALFGFTAAAAMLVAAREWKRGALLQAVPLMALGAALAWPYFDYWTVLTKGATETWFRMPLFENRALALGPLLLAVPLVFLQGFARKRWFVLLGALFCFGIYLVSCLRDIRIGGRFLIFTAFFVHLAIALTLVDAGVFRRETWTSGGRRCAMAGGLILFLFVPALPWRALGLRRQIDRVILPPAGALWTLQGDLHGGDVVMTDPATGYVIPAITGARVVAQAKGDPLIQPEIERRRADAWKFFREPMAAGARREMLRGYGVTHVLIDRRQVPELDPSLARTLPAIAEEVTTRDGVTLYRLKSLHARLPGTEMR